MENVNLVELFSLIVMIVWSVIFVFTWPFLLLAAREHQRSTIKTVALLCFFGLIQAIILWDTVVMTPEGLSRSNMFWITLYATRATSLLMAITIGVRTWRTMLTPDKDAVVLSIRQEDKIEKLQSDIVELRDEAVRVSDIALSKAEHQQPISEAEQEINVHIT